MISDGKVPEPLLESLELVSRDANTKNNAPVEKHVTIPPANQWTPSAAYDHPLFTSSSEGQASLQENWKMLDAEESFQSPTPRKPILVVLSDIRSRGTWNPITSLRTIRPSVTCLHSKEGERKRNLGPLNSGQNCRRRLLGGQK